MLGGGRPPSCRLEWLSSGYHARDNLVCLQLGVSMSDLVFVGKYARGYGALHVVLMSRAALESPLYYF